MKFGDLIAIDGGPFVYVHAPAPCGNGHGLHANCSLSTQPWPQDECAEDSHSVWTCRTCGDRTVGRPHVGGPLPEYAALGTDYFSGRPGR